MGMGLREYARHRGVAPSAVEKALKSGRILKESDGTIDPAKADAAWERNTNPAQQRKPDPVPVRPDPVPDRPSTPSVRQPTHQPTEPEAGPSMPGVPNYQMSRAIREAYNAKLARLDYEERNGKLVDRADVDRKWFEVGCRVRDRIQSLPSRMSAELAAMTDRKAIETFMDQELRNALEELAQ